jgi:hypothetical protein
MKNLTKAITLSAILAGAVLTIPAQAWWGTPWSGYNNNSNNSVMDNMMDGSGWGDMNFNMSMSGRGNGRGYNNYNGYNGYYTPYNAPYYGAPYAPYYGAPVAPAPAKKEAAK